MSTTPSITPSQGRGRGRGRPHQGRSGGGGRGKDKKDNKNNDKKQSNAPEALEELKDHVFIMGSAKAIDKYNKTQKALMNYFLTNLTEGQYVVQALQQGVPFDWETKAPTPPTPTVPTGTTAAAQRIRREVRQLADPPQPPPTPEQAAAQLRRQAQEDAEPVPVVSQYDEWKFKEHLRVWSNSMIRYESNMVKAYGILWKQCTLQLQNKLEARRDWTEIHSTLNAIDLLKAIKEVAQDYQDTRYPIESINDSLQAFINIKQREDETLANYQQRFKNVVEHMETQHGKLPMTRYVVTADPELHMTQAKAYDRLVAYRFMVGSYKGPGLKEHLSNRYAMGTDEYPKDLNAAVSLVSNYKIPGMNTRSATTNNDVRPTGLGFAQRGGRGNGRRQVHPNL